MKQYGIMLIGCGHIGREHMEDLYFREEFSVVAVVDHDPQRVAEFQRRYHASKGGTDYRPFLQEPAVDIVIIASYVDTHLSILEQCLAAGKHVLCEKPIARTTEEGQRFFRLVEQAKTKVLVAHVLRHNASYCKIADMIAQGQIGQLRLMRMVQNHHALDWPRYRRLMMDCPPIVDCGVHYLDVMQWFSRSRICQVGGISTKLDEDSPCDNHALLHVRMENGCVGYYEAGWSRSLSAQNVKEFVGDLGRITLTLQANRTTDREEGDLITLYRNDTGVYTTINVPAKYKDMYRQMRCLVDMIEADRPANPNIHEVMQAFNAAMTAQQAIAQGKLLTISDCND